MSIEEAAETVYPQLALPVLTKARANAARMRSRLEQLLNDGIPEGYASEDTSLVVFGSLARREWTSGSDLDWTYLIDGQANSDHLVIAQKIGKILREQEIPGPGQSGTFGNMAFSHDIIHQIGGQFDTNKNTTRRVLLLLESDVIGKWTQAHERVVKAVIDRYLEEDNHRLTEDGKSYRVPRFLLNDVVRFWRTMGVDFASKQRDRGGEEWGLRNAKLRMSRKLIFASGLLVCFSCRLDPALQKQISISTDDSAIKLRLVNHIRGHVQQTPLEIVAKSLKDYAVPVQIQRQFFSSYSAFLELLDHDESREALKKLRAKDSRIDPAFKKVREIGLAFEQALDCIFFENETLRPLTRKYGVF